MVELDIVVMPGEGGETAARSLTLGCSPDVEIHVVTEHGDRGWPVVQFDGDARDLIMVLINYGYGTGTEVAAMLRAAVLAQDCDC